MAATSPSPLLRHERPAAAAALAFVIVLAWMVTAGAALDLRWMAPANGQWTPGHFSAAFVMWSVMMAAMMLPSAASAIVVQASLRRHPVRDAMLFTAGYLVCWSAFGLLATVAQWALAAAGALSSPSLIRATPLVAAGLFLVAGIYQVTPLKRACLAKCRSSAVVLAERPRAGPFGPLLMGLEHGVLCVGCCWALMALLFAFGAMNLAWSAALALFVFAEKRLAASETVRRAGTVALLAANVWLLWSTPSLLL